MPFFIALKAMEKDFKWIEKCKQAWVELKEYLEQIHLLSSPRLGETLYIYLDASNFVVPSVLIREEDNKQLSVYYIRKVLNGPKVKYANTKKLVYSLVVVAQKLVALSHTSSLYTPMHLSYKSSTN